MRLVAARIEIAKPEGEIDRVDVFEVGSEKWKMKGEVRDRDRQDGPRRSADREGPHRIT
jgi:hypothetical protein